MNVKIFSASILMLHCTLNVFAEGTFNPRDFRGKGNGVSKDTISFYDCQNSYVDKSCDFPKCPNFLLFRK